MQNEEKSGICGIACHVLVGEREPSWKLVRIKE